MESHPGRLEFSVLRLIFFYLLLKFCSVTGKKVMVNLSRDGLNNWRGCFQRLPIMVSLGGWSDPTKKCV